MTDPEAQAFLAALDYAANTLLITTHEAVAAAKQDCSQEQIERYLASDESKNAGQDLERWLGVALDHVRAAAAANRPASGR